MSSRPFASLLALTLLLAVLSGCDDGGGQPDAPKTAASAPASPADEKPTADAKAAPAGKPVEARLTITYPRDGTLFPPEIVAPTFVWKDETAGVKRWSVRVRPQDGEEMTFSVDAPSWRPSEETWKAIKERSLERDAEVIIEGATKAAPAVVASSARVKIRTSKDPVGDSIFYREVPLPFLSAVQDPSRIRWRFGTVDSQEAPAIVLQNLPVCGNCHSFADNGSVLGLDVDYGNDKGAYAIIPATENMVLDDDKIITWADFKRGDGEITFGLLSRVSPTGRYVVSTVKDRSVFVATPDIAFSQLFFPIKGILVVYDRETGKFQELPGADNPEFVQTNAAWSPDGKEIIFARAPVYKMKKLEQLNAALVDEKDVPEFIVDKQPFRYDLYRIPFNDGKGGTAEPLLGASGDGMSNFFPKYSPDGKWIIFCKAANYMLLQPDSELWIVPAKGGQARRLNANTPLMNSWHSWSSNSRWLVFSSKVNTPYTQLFLTHIDENGMDSPPVLLERFTSPDRAANIPEFVRLPKGSISEIREAFLDSYSFLRAGMANERTGDYPGAERHYRRGLEHHPGDVELNNALGWTLFQMGKTSEAVVVLKRALATDPNHVKSHNNLALALVDLNRLQEAAEHYRKSVELQPKCEIYSDLGFLEGRLGNTEASLTSYKKALEVDPHCASAHFNLAVVAVQSGAIDQAETHYRQALEGKPNAETYNGLGYVLSRSGRNDEAVEQFRKAIEINPKFAPAYNNLASALRKQGKLEEAADAYKRSLAEKPSQAIFNDLGTVLTELGRKDEAAEQFRNAKAMATGATAQPRPASVQQ